ncbi:MAG: sensor histidine kinase [Dysgonomonas sp.]
MKKILLTLVFLVSLCTDAQVRHSIRDLQPNDVISMKITVPVKDAVLNSLWDFEHGCKIDVDFQILSVEDDSIRMIIKPTRLLALFNAPTTKGSLAYFDSNYYTYSDNKPWFYLFADNSVVASVNMNDWGVGVNYKNKTRDINHAEEEKATGRSRKEWYTQTLNIPKGLKVIDYGGEPITEVLLDFDKIIKLSLNSFTKEWNKKSNDKATMPWMINIGTTPKNDSSSPAFIQITSASFKLQPNISISFTPSKGTPEDRIFIQVGNEKIFPIRKTNNAYQFAFFLPSPKRAYMNGLTLDLTPDDSLIIGYNASANSYIFSGKGIANSLFTQTIAQLFDAKLANVEGDAKDATFLENIKKNFQKNEEFFKSTLSQYIDGMNDYWIRSARLSFDYWYINERLKLYSKATDRFDLERLPMVKQYLKENPDKLNEANKSLNIDDLEKLRDGASIPWQNDHFVNVFPYGDYLYQPYTYHPFIKDFFRYKAKETNNTIMTGMQYLQEHIPSYYFAKSVFFGYPRSYLNSETLKYLMVNFQLEENNREYEDFLKAMHDPEIRESVVNLHQQLTKIEPGANIKELKLEIEKHIPLKSNSDKYIILLVGDDKIGFNPHMGAYETNIKEIYESLITDLRESNLADKVDICIITTESSKINQRGLSDIQSKIIFVSDKDIRDYTDKVVNHERSFIVLRSNGEILNRYHPSEYKSSIFFLIKLIQEDIDNQKNKDSAFSGVLVIIIAVLLSILVTFFLVRYIILRRERLKRHIQELELKAIRAQINPHFTFNALGSIQNLIAQKKDKEASEYLVNFAKLLRMVLSNSEKKLVPLSDEIQLLDLYLQLEQLRVSFKYTINIDPDIDIQNEEIPGMLIQPIVENAVKHAITPNGGEITLNFKITVGALLVEVIDSGKGFDHEVQKSSKGFGLRSVKERLSLLNKELHLDIDLEIENIIDNSNVIGAKVSLHIPV